MMGEFDMKIRAVKSRKDWHKIKKLYHEAFPANEKKPFWMIRMKHYQNAADVWVLEESDEFAGLAITMNGADLVLLDYFAVVKEKRSGGIGSKAISMLQQKYGMRRFFLEIESVEDASGNREERLRRKKFYLDNGMGELGVRVTLFGVDMELLGYNCRVAFDEYKGLYHSTYGNWAAVNVRER